MALKFRDFYKPQEATDKTEKKSEKPEMIARPAAPKKKTETSAGRFSSSTLTAPGPEEKNFAIFQVGSEWYGIDLNLITEILHNFDLIPVPHLPAAFTGVTNLRGESLPVVDLSRLFGLSTAPAGTRSCIIVKIDAAKIGLLSDSDVEIVNQALGRHYPLPSSFTKEEALFLEGIFWYRDLFIGIFFPERALQFLSEWRIEHEEK